jgi:hypothetical protein
MIDRIRKVEFFTFWIFLILFTMSGTYIARNPLEFHKSELPNQNLSYTCNSDLGLINNTVPYIGTFENKEGVKCYILSFPSEYIFKQENPMLWNIMLFILLVLCAPTLYLGFLGIREKLKKTKVSDKD